MYIYNGGGRWCTFGGVVSGKHSENRSRRRSRRRYGAAEETKRVIVARPRTDNEPARGRAVRAIGY